MEARGLRYASPMSASSSRRASTRRS
jgi:hypothetical protein